MVSVHLFASDFFWPVYVLRERKYLRCRHYQKIVLIKQGSEFEDLPVGGVFCRHDLRGHYLGYGAVRIDQDCGAGGNAGYP